MAVIGSCLQKFDRLMRVFDEEDTGVFLNDVDWLMRVFDEEDAGV